MMDRRPRHLLKAAALLLGLLAMPTARAEHIWVEGEKPTKTTFKKHNWYDGVKKEMLSGQNWLSHYGGQPGEVTYDVQVTDGGEFTLWVRCNVTHAGLQYKIDGAAFKDADLKTDPRETAMISAKPDHRSIAWVKFGTFKLDAGKHSLSFKSANKIQNHGGIDCFVLSNKPFTPTGVAKPGDAGKPGKPDEWFPFLPAEDPFNETSIIDMRKHWHAPAGKFGPIKREGAKLVLNGKPVKLWGCGANVKDEKPRAWQESWAKYMAKYGINIVRQHSVQAHVGPMKKGADGKLVLDAKKLDEYDYWFATLKKQGIYTCWSVFYPHMITQDEGCEFFDDLPTKGKNTSVRSTSGVVALEPALQDSEWNYVKALLEHKNKYTGLRYIDDPALAVVEIHNEDSVFWHSPLNSLAGKKYPRIAARFKKNWATWLKEKYGTDAKLKAAWGAGMRKGDSLNNNSMQIYGAWQMTAEGPKWGNSVVPGEKKRLGDFIEFTAKLQRDYYDRREKRLRELGFKGLSMTTAWRAGGAAADPANLWTDDAMDVINRHNYFGGGEGGHNIKKGKVNNASHMGDPGGGLLAIGFYQVEDKPFSCTEWTAKPPNQWKAEAAPLFAFYGLGLQGWDASYHFLSARQHLTGGWPNLSSYVTDTPHYAGQFPALAFALHKGHITEAVPAAARRLKPEQLFQGIDPLQQDFTGGGYDDKALKGSLATPKQVLAIGRVTALFRDDAGTSEKADWDKFWDQGNKVVKSSTGELTWDYGKRVVTVHTPKTQGVIGFAGGSSYELPGVKVAIKTPFVSVLFTPLDDQPLAQSKHILITALAQDKQTGATYNADGTQLTNVGSPPLLLEPVQATITLKGAAPSSVKVVDIYGDPTDVKVPATGNSFDIDGRYRTYYYEVKR